MSNQPHTRETISHSRRLLPVLAVFTCLCAIYIWAIPPLEGSDEFEHFAYVTWLITEGTFPPQGEAGWYTPVRQESGQSPLYYLLASIPARLAGVTPPVLFRPNPHFQYELDPTLPDNKNTALHYPADRGGGWRAIYYARTVSVAAGLLLIISVYALANVVWADKLEAGLPLAAAWFVAAMPQVVYHSSHVSNDILAAALSTLTLWALAHLIRQGPDLGRAVALGALWGLAALTKVNTLVLGLPIALALGWLCWTQFSRHRPITRSCLVAGLGTGAGFIAVAGWWFGRAWILYGSPLGLDTHCYQVLATCGPLRLHWPLWVQWRDTFYSFWAAFGLANIRPYDWVYTLFALLLLLALVGLGRVVWRWWSASAGKRPWTVRAMLLTLMAALVVANILLLYFWMQQILATYGRLLFPALGAFVVLLLYGLNNIHPRLARLAWLLPALLAWVAPFWLIHPAYTPPRPLEPNQVAELETSPGWRGWRYGDFAELVHLSLSTHSVNAGDLLPARVCWRTLARPDQNYTFFLQLVGPDNAVVAARYTYPGLGSYPTRIWQPGIVFCDTVRIPIPPDLADTLVYRVAIGWLAEIDDTRLEGVDGAGNALPPFIEAVRLVSGAPQPAVTPPPGNTAIRLADFELSDPVATWQPGHAYNLTLWWWTAEAVPVDYTVFIHLRDENNQLLAQADGPPRQGWYPTSWWTAGEVVLDTHTISLPAQVPPGTYQLVVGLYNPLNGERLGEEYFLQAVPLKP